MPFIQILLHLSTGCVFIAANGVEVFVDMLGGDFVGHVNKLAHIGIVLRITGDMTKSRGKPIARPPLRFGRRGEEAAVDVDHGDIR